LTTPKKGYKLVKSLFRKYVEIPEEWDVKKINDLFDFSNGINFVPFSEPECDIRVIALPNINILGNLKFTKKDDFISNETYEKFSKSQLFKDDLLMAMTDVSPKLNLLGKTILLQKNGKFALSYRVGRLRIKNSIKNNVDLNYIKNSLNFDKIRRQITSKVNGTAQFNVTVSTIKNCELFLPELIEQQKISSIFSNVDHLISLYGEIISKIIHLKLGVTLEILTKGIKHKKFKKINLGVRSQKILIPESWGAEKLSEFSEHITKGATPTTYGYEWSKNLKDVLFIRNECILENDFQLEGSLRITKEAHEFMNRSKINSCDLLISITGNIGKTCLFPNTYDEANINQHIARIRINSKKLLPKYLVNILNDKKFYSYYYTINQGLTHPHLSLGQVRNTIIPLPSIQEQQKITTILNTLDDKISNLKLKMKYLEYCKKGLMQKLLTGQIRVSV